VRRTLTTTAKTTAFLIIKILFVYSTAVFYIDLSKCPFGLESHRGDGFAYVSNIDPKQFYLIQNILFSDCQRLFEFYNYIALNFFFFFRKFCDKTKWRATPICRTSKAVKFLHNNGNAKLNR